MFYFIKYKIYCFTFIIIIYIYSNIFVGNNENLGVFRTLRILIDIIQNLKQLLKYLLDFFKIYIDNNSI